MLLGLVKLVPFERCPDEAGPLGRDDHGDATSVDVYIVEAYVKCHEVSFIIGYNVSVIILTITVMPAVYAVNTIDAA